MIGAEIPDDVAGRTPQGCGICHRIADVALARIAGRQAARAAAGQIATAFCGMVALTRQLPRGFVAEASDDRDCVPACRNVRIDHACQQPVQCEHERDDVSDDGVTKPEAQLTHEEYFGLIESGRLDRDQRAGASFRAWKLVIELTQSDPADGAGCSPLMASNSPGGGWQ